MPRRAASPLLLPVDSEKPSSLDAGDLRRRWLDAFRGVRAETERRAAAPFGRGPGRPVDAGCQPDQMASGAHHLVLRAVSAGAARARLPAVRRALRLSVQLLLCRGRAAACAAASAAWSRGRTRSRSRPIRAHVDAAVERLIETASDDELQKCAADPGDRAAPRAAASGADPHRHPARFCAKPDRSGL